MSAADRDADRRRRLVAAGMQAFGTDGYAATTIEGLCRAAGIAARNFYDHFASREALLAAVYDEVVAAHTEQLVAALSAEPEDLERHVRSGLDAAVRGWAADERHARIALVEVVGVGPAMEAHRLAVIRGYAALLAADGERLAERGLVSRPPGPLVAMALVGALTQILTDWQHRPAERAPIEDVVDALSRVYVAALA
jgi:AcrR family transcriptional regulator